jgi:predicted small metal-binding protein
MTKVLNCSDLNPGCDFEMRANSEDDILRQATAHARTAHNMQNIPPDVLSKARSAIRDEGEPLAQKAGPR